jgi:endoglucanase
MTPPRYGFNFPWMLGWRPGARPSPPDLKALDFMAEHGFTFVRIPTTYWFWTNDFDYLHPDEGAFAHIDSYLQACRSRGLHMSLNVHRAPGYCINGNDLERHNLWLDGEPQDGFVFLWETWTRRYRDVSADDLSFDLVNEPPNVGEYGFTRENHSALIRRVVASIRAVDPKRPIVIDGIGGGHLAMPELADLGVTHSGRGYMPFPVSHHGATWWTGWKDAPPPLWPGVAPDGEKWNRDSLMEFYSPWREVESRGVQVHIGECGCYNKTPNDIAMRWMADLFSVFHELGWGFSLWEFKGPFGIADHGREGAKYETMGGFKVDRALLELIESSMVKG